MGDSFAVRRISGAWQQIRGRLIREGERGGQRPCHEREAMIGWLMPPVVTGNVNEKGHLCDPRRFPRIASLAATAAAEHPTPRKWPSAPGTPHRIRIFFPQP